MEEEVDVMLKEVVEKWREKKALNNRIRRSKKKEKDFEKWKKEHPVEYMRAYKKAEAAEVARVSQMHIEKGYITTPYCSYDEMMEGIRTHGTRDVTEEEKEAICRSFNIPYESKESIVR